jgi:hypothetical protein
MKPFFHSRNAFYFLLPLALALAVYAVMTAKFHGTRNEMSSLGHREASRGIAMAFGEYANLPASVNVASIVNTFQTPSSLLSFANVASEVQSQMLAGSPAGTPFWDGHGPLPGAVGTGGFNPSFSFDYSGCSIVPVTFYSVFSPSSNLPTLWCGAIAQGLSKVAASSNGANSTNSANSASEAVPTRAVQLQ